MQIISLADFGSVGTQLVGARGVFALVSVDCELVIAVLARCGGAVGRIESCSLWLRASNERRGEGHDEWVEGMQWIG